MLPGGCWVRIQVSRPSGHSERHCREFPWACSVPIPPCVGLWVQKPRLRSHKKLTHQSKRFQGQPASPQQELPEASITAALVAGDDLLTDARAEASGPRWGEARCHQGQASWQPTGKVLAVLCWLQVRCTLFLEKKHAPHSPRQAPWHPSCSLCPAGSPHLHPCPRSTCITTGSSPPCGSWELLGTSGL